MLSSAQDRDDVLNLLIRYWRPVGDDFPNGPLEFQGGQIPARRNKFRVICWAGTAQGTDTGALVTPGNFGVLFVLFVEDGGQLRSFGRVKLPGNRSAGSRLILAAV